MSWSESGRLVSNTARKLSPEPPVAAPRDAVSPTVLTRTSGRFDQLGGACHRRVVVEVQPYMTRVQPRGAQFALRGLFDEVLAGHGLVTRGAEVLAASVPSLAAGAAFETSTLVLTAQWLTKLRATTCAGKSCSGCCCGRVRAAPWPVSTY